MSYPRLAVGLAALCLASGATFAQVPPPPPFQPPGAGDVTLPEVTVNAPRVSLGSYLAPSTTTALRVPAPTQDVPVSVQVVPQALIQDRGALTINQAIDTVSGVERSVPFPNSLSFRVRGFVDSSTTLRDGFREQANVQDIQGVDRIEVLKGPASVLYGGAVSSGGTVDVITKTPLDGNFVRTGLTGGSFGLFRGTVDANRDLGGDGRVVVRLNAAYDHSDTFRQFGYDENTFINPTLRWRPTDRDEVTFITSYQHSNYTWDQFQSPIVRPVLGLPLSRTFSDPDLGASHQDSWRLAYNWVHLFDSGVQFRSGFNASVNNYSFGSERLYLFSLRPNNATLNRAVSIGPQISQNYDLQNELSGEFHTGPLRHQWLAGTELYRQTYAYKNVFANIPTLNIYAPAYGVSPGPFTLGNLGGSHADGAAGYVQDFVTVVPQVRLLVGGRYDVTDTVGYNRIAGTRSPNAANQFSPRVGITYEPVPTTALYFNWANSFIPTTSAGTGGTALPPSSSEQYEVGVKQQFLDKRIQATAALFQITRTNVVTPDLANPGFSIASGEQRSRGLELDVAGEIRAGWKVVASYAYTYADVTRDNRLVPGSLLAGVARHAGQVWTTYEFGEGTLLPGFGAGLGVRAESRREATLPNTFFLPGYTRLDAAAWYKFHVQSHPVRAQLNVQNITNARIYDTDGGYSLRPQQPLTVLGTLSSEF